MNMEKFSYQAKRVTYFDFLKCLVRLCQFMLILVDDCWCDLLLLLVQYAWFYGYLLPSEPSFTFRKKKKTRLNQCIQQCDTITILLIRWTLLYVRMHISTFNIRIYIYHVYRKLFECSREYWRNYEIIDNVRTLMHPPIADAERVFLYGWLPTYILVW